MVAGPRPSLGRPRPTGGRRLRGVFHATPRGALPASYAASKGHIVLGITTGIRSSSRLSCRSAVVRGDAPNDVENCPLRRAVDTSAHGEVLRFRSAVLSR